MKEIFGESLEGVSGGKVKIVDKEGNLIKMFGEDIDVIDEDNCPDFGPGCNVIVMNNNFSIKISYNYIKRIKDSKKEALKNHKKIKKYNC